MRDTTSKQSSRLIWNILFFSTIILGTLCFPGTLSADEGLDEYNLGLGLYKQRRWDLAAKTFQKFVENNPKHNKAPLGKLYLGQTLVNLKKYKEARTTLQSFVKTSPQNVNIAQAKYRIAECSYFLDEFATAIPQFEEFLKMAKPKEPLLEWALPYLADAQYRSGKSKDAISTFELAIRKYPKGRMADDCRFGQAKAYESLKQIAPAIKIYEQMASDKKHSRAPQARLNHGLLLFDLKKYDLAEASFDRLEADFPTNTLVPLAQLNGGFAAFYQKDYPAAVERFQKASKQKSQSPTANYWMGVSYKKMGKYSSAIEKLKPLSESAQAGSLKEEALLQWADCEVRQNHPKEARTLYQKFATDYKNSPRAPVSLHKATEAALLEQNAQAGLGLVSQFKKQYAKHPLLKDESLLEAQLIVQQASLFSADKKAEKETKLNQAAQLLTALSSDKNNASTIRMPAQFHLARVQQSLGQHAKVLDSLKALLVPQADYNPQQQFPDAYLLKAISELDLKKWQDAEVSAATFSKLKPNDPRIEQALSTRAIALAHLGDLEASKKKLQSLSNRFPKSTLVAESVYQVAELTLDNKNYSEAESLFGSLVEMGKANHYYTSSLHGFAWSQFEGKKYAKAAASFESLTKIDLKEKQTLAAEARYMQGTSFLRDNQLPQAAEAFVKSYTQFATRKTKANPTPPKRTATINSLGHTAYESAREAGRAYTRLKKIALANQAYQVAYEELKLQPKDKQTHLDKLLDEWALLNYNQENYKESDRIYQILVTETPQSDRADDAKLILAEGDFIAGRMAAAQKVFQTLSKDPSADGTVQRRAAFQLSGIALEKKDWKGLKAISEDYAKRLPATPGLPEEANFLDEMLARQATAELELGNPKTAIKLVTPLVTSRLNPDGSAKVTEVEKEWTPMAWMVLIESHRREKKYDDCRTAQKQFAKAFPKSPFQKNGLVSIGRCDIAQAKFDDARKVFQAVIDKADGAKNKAAAEAQFYIAETWMIQKKFSKALPLYLRVSLIYQGFPKLQSASLFQAGQCDEVMKNVPQAVDSYKQLIKDFPRSDFAERAKARIQALSP